MKDEYHLWFEPDERYEGLEALFDGYNIALKKFRNKYQECDWYDVGFYREETDLIYGIALISLQNYINKWCVDFLESKIFGYERAYQYYDRDSKIVKNGVTQIRLIIELANYFKHRDDDGNLQHHTFQVLDNVNILNISKSGDERYEDELLIEGILLLNDNIFDLSGLMLIVKKWFNDILFAAEKERVTNVSNIKEETTTNMRYKKLPGN